MAREFVTTSRRCGRKQGIPAPLSDGDACSSMIVAYTHHVVK
jgi:hypothetical protein